MSGVGKNRIRDRHERVIEIRGSGRQHLSVWCRIRAGSDHAHQAGNQDRQTRRDAAPSELVKGPGKAEQQHGNGKDARVQHQAQLRIRQGGEADLAGQHLRPRGADGEDDGARRQHLAPDRAEEDHARVAHVVDLRVPELELDQDPGGEGGEHAQEDDDDQPRHDADHGQRARQRQHAVRHDLGDHEHRHHAPGQRFVADLVGGFVAEDVVVYSSSQYQGVHWLGAWRLMD